MNRLDSAEEVVRVMLDLFQLDRQAEEYAYLLAMSTKCKLLGVFEVAHGTCNSAVIGVREILVRALLSNAVKIVLIHNHPSGDCSPSREDINITERLKQASALVGIEFCDHIIIGKGVYYSFHDKVFE